MEMIDPDGRIVTEVVKATGADKRTVARVIEAFLKVRSREGD